MGASFLFAGCALASIGGIAFRWKEKHLRKRKIYMAVGISMLLMCVFLSVHFAFSPPL